MNKVKSLVQWLLYELLVFDHILFFFFSGHWKGKVSPGGGFFLCGLIQPTFGLGRRVTDSAGHASPRQRRTPFKRGQRHFDIEGLALLLATSAVLPSENF